MTLEKTLFALLIKDVYLCHQTLLDKIILIIVIALRIGDIKRELELGNIPLDIKFIPKKDRELIGERVAFLGNDGMLKRYLYWRGKKGERESLNRNHHFDFFPNFEAH